MFSACPQLKPDLQAAAGAKRVHIAVDTRQ